MGIMQNNSGVLCSHKASDKFRIHMVISVVCRKRHSKALYCF